MVYFNSFYGIIRAMSDFPIGNNDEGAGCYKIVSVDNGSGGIINFIISPNTYFVNPSIILVGDFITGYYDKNAPVPLIYPPQYEALIIVKDNPYQNVKVDYFNEKLISSDGLLKLNIGPNTQRLLKNEQPFYGNLMNRNLIVIFGPATRSIPAQTTPYEIVVWCE